MRDVSEILKELELNLKLSSQELTNWNRSYLKNHEERYKHDFRILKEYYRSGEILEIGSIPCHFTYCLRKLGYPVIGVDLDPCRAREFIEKNALNVKRCDIEKEKIPFQDENFGFVIFNEVFEHLRVDPISALQEINRVLKPNGIMLMTTPNLYYLPRIIRFNLGMGFNDAYKEFEKIHTLGHMGHIREYSTREVKTFLRKTEFEPIKIEYKSYRRGKEKKNMNPSPQQAAGYPVANGTSSFCGFHPAAKIKTYLLNILDSLCFFLPKLRSHQIFIAKKSILSNEN